MIKFTGRSQEKFGDDFRYNCNHETMTAKKIGDRLAEEGGYLEIYDQAETGSIYGNMHYSDNKIFPVRISDHPTRTTVAVVNNKRRKAFEMKTN